MERRNIVRSAVLTCALVLSAALAQGSTLKIATIGEPPSLDPTTVTSDLVGIITQHIFETLYTFDSSWNIVPLLASGPAKLAADGRSYTIPLRSGVKFHDGSPMSADDVVASLQRWVRLSPRGKQAGEHISAVTASGNSVVIRMKDRFSPLLSLLAFNNGAAIVIPKALAAQDSLKSFVGTGPYRLLEQKPDQYIRLTRFTEYSSPAGKANGYGGERRALVDELRFIPVPNAVTRLQGVLNGEYDFADNLPTESYPRVAAQKSLTAVTVKPFAWPLMIMNTASGPLASVNARRAVLASLNMDAMLLAAFGSKDFYTLEGSLYPKGTPYYSSVGVDQYNAGDPARARTLLKTAGYTGAPIRILTSTQYDFLYKMSLVAAEQMKAAGFTVDLQVLDWATLLQKRNDKSAWDAFFTFHTFVPEPSLITIMNPAYPGWWDSKTKQAALSGFNATTGAGRSKLFAAVQKTFYQDVPTIKIGSFYNLAARGSTLQGFQPAPWPYFWNVKK